jgi:hypothetical protein
MSNLEKINNLISQLNHKNFIIIIRNIQDYLDILQLLSNVLTDGSEDHRVNEDGLETELNKICELIKNIDNESKNISKKRNLLCNIFSSCYSHDVLNNEKLHELTKKLNNLKDRILDCEEILIEIPNIIMNYEAELPLTVSYTDTNTRPSDYKDDAYGYGFNNKMFLEFEVPNLNVHNHLFKSVKISGTFNDQHFGGSGQSHIRVYVNKEIKEIKYYKMELDDSNYTIVLSSVKKGDIISVWACTPEWNGWSITITKATVDLYFLENDETVKHIDPNNSTDPERI